MNICTVCKQEILGSHYRWNAQLKESIKYIPAKCNSCERKENPQYKYETENRLLKDGIYDVTDIDYLAFEKINWDEPEKLEAIKEVQDFIRKWPNYIVAQAYQARTLFLFATGPENITKKTHKEGAGFNYGSCNLLTNCPKSILILAEDD